VRAPFATPPTERDRKRLWLGLGIGAALLVVCCGGGVVGLGALVVNRTDALRTEASRVVTEYLSDLSGEHYDSAYRLLCGSLRGAMTESQFADRQDSGPRVARFAITSTTISGAEVVVGVAVTGDDGTSRYRTLTLVEEGDPPALHVCGGE
jgi:hypothetical protein